ncbi:antigen 5 like allergen Cul n 1-like [Condylostylus longicornis]|uniref:antigen 5 like allergen Cul n 1-like n=1 Tax=Condylostylus longicornis TaxID=2530218 RepID=UPI00244DD73A|nr:antigen 5 like allergen Cul n 1-like [Condylostylus longicornis]
MIIRLCNAKCSGKLLNINKNSIVNQHNELRNRIASGGLYKYNSASRMAEMKWSPELAIMAEFNVKRCLFEHDKCRSTPTFPYSGQSLALRRQYGIQNWNYNNSEIRGSINSWFNEYKLTDMSVINKYRSTGKNIGHFTVMVKDTNTHVGCAGIRYQDGIWDTILFACNYADTNILGRPIYRSGPPASQCVKRSPRYKALCESI